jgi:hypothetical protein
MPDLLAVSFTAARDLDAQGCAVIVRILTQVPHADRYITGGAPGGDAFIGRWLALARPQAEHVVIVPADRSQVDPWWNKSVVRCSSLVEVIEMPLGTTYADRNCQLVQRGSMMYGFPAYPEDDPRSRRSGSWQACRMARRAGKLCQWQCVKPPHAGRAEKQPSEFRTEQLTLPVRQDGA